MGHDYIGKMSWRGSNIDLRFGISKRIELGALIGWNYLYERRDRIMIKLDSSYAVKELHINEIAGFNTFIVKRQNNKTICI